MGIENALRAVISDGDEYSFEKFCLELLTTEPECGRRTDLDPYGQREEYGKRGQAQKGVDFWAVRADGMRDVGQCKKYASIGPDEIEKASTKFLDHWDSHWKDWRIKRFILFCGCTLEGTSLQDQVNEEVERFGGKGLVYEAWGVERLAAECERRGHLSLRLVSGSPLFRPLVAHLRSQSDRLSEIKFGGYRKAWASRIDRDLREMLDRWRELPQQAILDNLDLLIEQAKDANDVEAQALAIRRKVSFMIDMDSRGVEESRRLFDLALTFDSSECEKTTRLRARLLDAEGESEDALSILASGAEEETKLLLAGMYVDKARRLPYLSNSQKRDAFLRNAHDLLCSTSGSTDPQWRYLNCVLKMFKSRDAPPDLGSVREELELLLKETRWWRVQYLLGVVEYLSGFLADALPDGLVDFPPPFPQGLLLVGSVSADHLAKAEGIFSQLLSRSDSLIPQGALKIWRLGCLSYLKGREAEALSLSNSLLKEEPSGMVVMWAAARKDRFDKDAVKATLRARIESDSFGIQDIVALFNDTVTPLDEPEALRELETLQERLLESDLETHEHLRLWWTSQRVRRLAALGRTPDALQQIAEAEQCLKVKQDLRYLLAAQSTSKGLIDLVESDPEYGENPLCRYDYLSALMEEKQWDKAMEVVRRISAESPTEEGVRLSSLACWQSGRFDTLVEIVERWGESCFQTRFLPRLRGYYAVSLLNVGRLLDARREAKLAYQACLGTPCGAAALADLILVQFRSGNLDEAVSRAKEMMRSPIDGLTAHDALFLATVLASDTHLSERDSILSLLRHASKCGLSDEQVVPAYLIALKFGADAIAEDLMKRFPEISRRRQDVVQMIPADQGIVRIRQQIDHVQDIWEQYRFGQIPVHFLSVGANVPLPVLYHLLPSLSFQSLSFFRTRPVYVFHGRHSRPGSKIDIPESSRLRADVSSLLLAHHLGILNSVEACFAPLLIASETFEMLIKNRQELLPLQPHRLSAMERVLDACLRGSIRGVSFTGKGEATHSFLPPETRQFLDLAAEQGAIAFPGSKIVTNGLGGKLCATRCMVLCCLRRSGHIDQPTFDNALRRLRIDSACLETEQIPFESGGVILVDAMVIEEFACMPGLFEALLASFQVIVPQPDLDSINSYVRDVRTKRELAGWVDELIKRISSGLEAKEPRYAMVTSPGVAGEGEDESHVELRLMKHLLEAGEDGKEVFWTDDRYINGFANTEDKTGIATLFDILNTMRVRGRLSDSDYYSILMNLRGGNFQYVPLSAGEILHHLKNAPIENGAVRETRELRLLRRSVAASLTPPFCFQPTEPSAIDQSEVQYVFSILGASVEAAKELFRGRNEEVQPRLRWLRDSILVEYSLLDKVFPDHPTVSSPGLFRATTISRYYVAGLEMGDSQRRKDYFNWIEKDLAKSWRSVESDLHQDIARSMDHSMRLLRGMLANGEVAGLTFDAAQRFCIDLPDEVSSDLLSRKGIPDLFAVERVRSIKCEPDFVFSVNDLADIYSSLCKGETALIKEMQGKASFRAEFQDGIVTLVAENGERLKISCPELEILHTKKEKREEAVKRGAKEIDLPPSETPGFIHTVLSTKDPRKRINYLLKEREEAAKPWYSRLAESLKRSRRFQEEDLYPPPLKALARHIRMPTKNRKKSSWESVWAESISHLLGDVSLLEGFLRLSLLPVPISSEFVARVEKLTDTEQHDLVIGIEENAVSPMDRIHLVSLLLRLKNEDYATIAREVLGRLLALPENGDICPVLEALESFLCLLESSERLIRTDKDAGNWSEFHLLAFAWIHAGKVYRCFQYADADPTSMATTLRTVTDLIPICPLRSEPFFGDIIQPLRLRVAYLLVRFLGHAVESSPSILQEPFIERFLKAATSDLNIELLHSLYRDESTLTNCVQSFLVEEPVRVWQAFGTEDISMFTEESRLKRLEEAVNHLKSDIDDATASRIVFLSRSGSGPSTSAAQAILYMALNLRPRNKESCENFALMCGSLRYIVQGSDDTIVQGVEERLVSSAASRACSPKQVMESALGIVHCYPPGERARVFGRIISRILDHAPCFATEILPTVSRLWLLCPSEDAPHLQALLLRLRATA